MCSSPSAPRSRCSRSSRATRGTAFCSTAARPGRPPPPAGHRDGPGSRSSRCSARSCSCSPTGRPRGRWRIVGWGLGSGAALLLVSFPFVDEHLDDVLAGETNPLVLPSSDPAGRHGARRLGYVVLLASLVGAAVSVVFRWRRAGVVERQQTEVGGDRQHGASWTALIVNAASAVIRCATVRCLVSPTCVLAGIFVAIGIAVLRHRLYDIDLVINRAIVYVAARRVRHGRLRPARRRDRRARRPQLGIGHLVVGRWPRSSWRWRSRRSASGRAASPTGSSTARRHRPTTCSPTSASASAARCRRRSAAVPGPIGGGRRRRGLGRGPVDPAWTAPSVRSLARRMPWPTGAVARGGTGDERSERARPHRPRGPAGRGASRARQRRLVPDLARQASAPLSNVRLTMQLEDQLDHISRQAAELRGFPRSASCGPRTTNGGASSATSTTARSSTSSPSPSSSAPPAARRRHRSTGARRRSANTSPTRWSTLRALARGDVPAAARRGRHRRCVARPHRRDSTCAPRVDDRLPARAAGATEVEAAMYFCCLEALQNVTKHAPGADVDGRPRARRRRSSCSTSATTALGSTSSAAL